MCFLDELHLAPLYIDNPVVSRAYFGHNEIEYNPMMIFFLSCTPLRSQFQGYNGRFRLKLPSNLMRTYLHPSLILDCFCINLIPMQPQRKHLAM